jgi:preprotein translocase subunit SecE
MNAKADAPESGKLDTVKWLGVWLLLGLGLVGFYYFSQVMPLLRVLSLLALGGVAVWLALQTEKGRFARDFLRGAQTEVRKVVWPTRKETVQVTGIVVLMVIVMALVIWLVDSLLFWIVKELTS